MRGLSAAALLGGSVIFTELVQASPASDALIRRNNGGNPSKSKKPNFVYIIADDQDAPLAHPEFMPLLHKYVGSKGVNYTNFYTPISQCCPSRVGFLRGQQAHSHNITYVSAPFGGYDVYDAYGYNGNNLFPWLQEVGYQTFYVGKLMNGNNAVNAQKTPIQGLNGSSILMDPTTYSYINSSYIIDAQAPKHYPGEYSTDTIRDMGLNYLEKVAKSDSPFFVGIAPIGPHSAGPVSRMWDAPIPASRHESLFPDAIVPRNDAFNPEKVTGVSWVRNLARLNETVIDYIDNFYRNRLRAVQAVDELVEATIKKLEEFDLMDNTYVIYTADNGYTLGSHRRTTGKTTGYESDIRVPFVVRGPGIKPGEDTHSAHSNIDITATMLHLAGAGPKTFDLDGRVMPWGEKGASVKELGSVSHQLSEFWLVAEEEGKWANFNMTLMRSPGSVQTNNNTYRMLRVIEADNNWAYSIWCTGERELYNMQTDSIQYNNLLAGLNEEGPFAPIDSNDDTGRLASRLDALMLYLKFCHGTACRFSWIHLFPNGEAKNLKEALNPEFDDYFDSIPKIHYKNCNIGFFLESEFPYWTTDLAYSSKIQYGNSNSTMMPGKRMRARDLRAPALWWEQTW